MKKAVVYASTTGNTEIMAKAVAEGAKASGAETILVQAATAAESEVLSADLIFLGSPAMGAEVLEDTMEVFFCNIEGKISGKKIAIFGSYDWGDGQWLRDWAERIKTAGAEVVNGDGLMLQLTPDSDGISQCEQLGKI